MPQFTREQVATGAVVGLLAAGAFGLWAVNRRAELARVKGPDWLDGDQPADGVASDIPILTAQQSWAANRCLPMAACCGDNTAGTRIRRTYPATLASSAGSFIRGGFSIAGGC